MKKKTISTISDISVIADELLTLKISAGISSLISDINLWLEQYEKINSDNALHKPVQSMLRDKKTEQELLSIFLLKKISLYFLYLINNRDRDIEYKDLFILKEKVDRYLAIN